MKKIKTVTKKMQLKMTKNNLSLTLELCFGAAAVCDRVSVAPPSATVGSVFQGQPVLQTFSVSQSGLSLLIG